MVTEPHLLELRREPDCVHVRLRIPADLSYLAGHFPGTPIVPGVVLLRWALELGRRQFPLPPAFKRMSAVKFMRIVPLDTELGLTLRCAGGELAFEYRHAGRGCVQGRAHFADA